MKRRAVPTDRVERDRRLGRLPRRGQDEIPIGEHRAIGRALAVADAVLTTLTVRLWNTHGRRARASRLAVRADRLVGALRSELEELLFATLDGDVTWADRDAMKILHVYYPPRGER